MAKKTSAPTPPIAPEPSPVPAKAAVPPAPVEHDFDKSVKLIVSKSNRPLTFKQIHALHEIHVTATGSVEDAILSLVKNNKLKLTAGTEKTVTLSRESLSRLVESQPNDATMTMSVNSVSVFIDDDPKVAIPQFLCLTPGVGYTNRQIFDKLTNDYGKTNMSRLAVNETLGLLTDQGTINRDPVTMLYSCC